MLTSIDLFCGAGGLSLGLEDAGFRTVVSVERDEDACATYSMALPDVKLICADAQIVDYSPWKGVDLVAGGPPCQPFSTGGHRKGRNDSRDLLPEFVRAVLEIRPRAFLIENVPGLASASHAGYVSEVLRPLAALYNISAPTIINAADFGVPQSRKRLLIVGTRDGLFSIPTNIDCKRMAAGSVLTKQPVGEHNSSKVVYAKNPDLRPNPYHGQLFNGGGRAIDLEQPAPTILASAGGNKTHFVDAGRRVPPYHRHLMRGGKPRVGELPEARRLTVLESALLQTFPRSMVFSGSRSSQYAQIGNAVPPTLAREVAGALGEYLSRRKRARRVRRELVGA